MRTGTPAELTAAFASAMQAGDLDRAIALWHPDAAIIRADGELVSGRDAVADALRALIDNDVTLRIDLAAVYDAGEVALGAGTLTMRASNGGGEPFEHSSDAFVVYRRDRDGGWLIALDAPWGLPAG